MFREKKYLFRKLKLKSIPEKLPFFVWIPKMHKTPFSKQRFLSVSAICTTKPLSKIITLAFKIIQKQHMFTSKYFTRKFGINPFWILKN